VTQDQANTQQKFKDNSATVKGFKNEVRNLQEKQTKTLVRSWKMSSGA
jgi:hypothetical protein